MTGDKLELGPAGLPGGIAYDPHRLYSIADAVSDPRSPIRGCCSASWLYSKVKAGEMPGVVRFGRKLFVTEAGLREFIANGGAR